VTTSELVSILSVGLPAIGALVSAVVSFVGVLPGTDRRLHRLVSIHNEMPPGEGRAALEDAVNELAVRAARRVVATRGERRRDRRKVDAGKVLGVVIVVLVGGGAAWGLYELGRLATPFPVLQWTLWVIGILVTLCTTLIVTVGGMTDVFEDEPKGEKADDKDKARDDQDVPA
jgi:hypothetical protein